MEIPIRHIKVNEKQKKKLDLHKVDKHRIAFERGEDVFPIDVIKIGEDLYNICGNGRHRFFGALEAGLTSIEVNILN